MAVPIVLLGLLAMGTARGDTYYVWINSPADGPGTAWSNAFHTIQGAISIAADGDTVLVTNGVYDSGATMTPGYSSLNRLVITNSINVRSVNGPDVTIIVGAQASGGGNGDDAVRGVYMSAGVLSGFTITNGHTMTTDDWDYDRAGGGINMCGGNGMASNCTISGNSAGDYGGGSAYGTLNDSTLSCNSAMNGGGSYYVALYNCRIADNSAIVGGGSYQSTLNNCMLTGNSASYYGGGSVVGTLINCTLFGNSANQYGGGSIGGVLRNCISYSNTAGTSGDNWYAATPDISYTCTTPDPGGTGNITNDPQLVNALSENYRLSYGSPCIDAGNNAFMHTMIDLDGNVRIVDGDTNGAATVDMGAYEYERSLYDSDGDGLTDGAEVDVYRTNPLNNNTDGDLCSDFEEFIADTDGSDSNDYFRIDTVSNILPEALFFESSAFRHYTLQGCANLAAGGWTNVPGAGPRVGMGGWDSLEDTNRPPIGPFYRLVVELQ